MCPNLGSNRQTIFLVIMRNKAFLKKSFFLSALFSLSFAGVDAEDGYHYYQDGNGVTWKFFVDNEQFPEYAKTKICDISGYSSEVTVPAVVYDEDQNGWSVYEIGGGYFLWQGNIPFATKTDITKVILSNGIARIGDRAFQDCTNLEYIELPESIDDLGSGWTFWGCKSLKEIRIPSKVQSIPMSGFADCISLESVELSNVQWIHDGAFSGCTSLASVIIPDKVEGIVSSAFSRCSSLESVSISSSVTSIREKVFSECYNLNSIIVDPANNVYDSRDNCNAIIETSSNTLIAGSNTTKIPESVTAIGSSAFYGYKLLEAIELPENINSIGDRAFAQCGSLSSLAIPKNVSSVGEFAFSGCNELTQVYSYIAEPFAINSNVFSATAKENATLYVPQGTLNLYKEADGWKEFANIVEVSIGDVEQISSESGVSDVYNLNGQKADALSGINIIRKTDGTTQKVLVK